MDDDKTLIKKNDLSITSIEYTVVVDDNNLRGRVRKQKGIIFISLTNAMGWLDHDSKKISDINSREDAIAFVSDFLYKSNSRKGGFEQTKLDELQIGLIADIVEYIL